MIVVVWFIGIYFSVYFEIGEKGDMESVIERENVLNDKLKDIWKEGVGKGKGGLGKFKVFCCINVVFFIDDYYGNFELIVKVELLIFCFLFGVYGWNCLCSGLIFFVEFMDYDE